MTDQRLAKAMVLHEFDATAVVYKRIVGNQGISCVYTGTVSAQVRDSNVEIFMLSGTVRVMVCVPVLFVAEQQPQTVLSSILGFHALTGCDT